MTRCVSTAKPRYLHMLHVGVDPRLVMRNPAYSGSARGFVTIAGNPLLMCSSRLRLLILREVCPRLVKSALFLPRLARPYGARPYVNSIFYTFTEFISPRIDAHRGPDGCHLHESCQRADGLRSLVPRCLSDPPTSILMPSRRAILARLLLLRTTEVTGRPHYPVAFCKARRIDCFPKAETQDSVRNSLIKACP